MYIMGRLYIVLYLCTLWEDVYCIIFMYIMGRCILYYNYVYYGKMFIVLYLCILWEDVYCIILMHIMGRCILYYIYVYYGKMYIVLYIYVYYGKMYIVLYLCILSMNDSWSAYFVEPLWSHKQMSSLVFH